MELMPTRFRSVTLLLVVLVAQLVLVAYQVKSRQDVPLIRVWTASAITPVARLLESGRAGALRLLKNYFLLAGVRQENQRLAADLDRLRMENRFLRSELGTATRAEALGLFQARLPSRTVAARVIGTGAEVQSKVIYLDRGASAGVRAGMAVVNPDGVVGRITAAYPATSQALLITAPGFSAGVLSANNHVEGVLKGQGRFDCRVEYIQSEEAIELGEWFYTSGDDRMFPRGLRVGQVTSVGESGPSKGILVVPSALARGLEEVLIITEGVHQPLPQERVNLGSAPLLPPPDGAMTEVPAAEQPGRGVVLDTDADRLREKYKKSAESRGFAYGDNPEAAKRRGAPPGSRQAAPTAAPQAPPARAAKP
jgi:rod shape-determining protein MreC